MSDPTTPDEPTTPTTPSAGSTAMPPPPSTTRGGPKAIVMAGAIVAILVVGQLAGILGALLAIPTAATIGVLIDEALLWRREGSPQAAQPGPATD